jgi:hypothetical protein
MKKLNIGEALATLGMLALAAGCATPVGLLDKLPEGLGDLVVPATGGPATNAAPATVTFTNPPIGAGPTHQLVRFKAYAAAVPGRAVTLRLPSDLAWAHGLTLDNAALLVNGVRFTDLRWDDDNEGHKLSASSQLGPSAFSDARLRVYKGPVLLAAINVTGPWLNATIPLPATCNVLFEELSLPP